MQNLLKSTETTTDVSVDLETTRFRNVNGAALVMAEIAEILETRVKGDVILIYPKKFYTNHSLDVMLAYPKKRNKVIKNEGCHAWAWDSNDPQDDVRSLMINGGQNLY
ncbi:hypothetical protein Bca52824_021715 [Brassica carinata]|uniref:Uncharacterized protein n=1 Tax=Brassica carinata TaxID=52824 RepID=A0A8X7VEU2_BRACI|nr:hypothetical protein Bca52824_021715 [Brassica carinata]